MNEIRLVFKISSNQSYDLVAPWGHVYIEKGGVIFNSSTEIKIENYNIKENIEIINIQWTLNGNPIIGANKESLQFNEYLRADILEELTHISSVINFEVNYLDHHGAVKKFISDDIKNPASLYYTKPLALPMIQDSLFPSKQPWIQFVVPIDLNNDMLTDFIFHLNGANEILNNLPIEDSTNLTNQLPESLIVYLSQDEGDYKVGNKEIFGYEDVNLGGVQRKYVVYDFNNDNYDDIIFATNKEDGRISSQIEGMPWNWAAHTASIISDDLGNYKIESIGPLSYNHSVEIYQGNGLNDIVLTQGTSYSWFGEWWEYWHGDPEDYFSWPILSYPLIDIGAPSVGLRYQDDSWIMIPDYPPIGGGSVTFIPSNTDLYAGFLFTEGYDANGNFDSFISYGQLKDGEWILADRYYIERSDKNANFIEYFSGNSYHKEISIVGGRQFADVASWESEYINMGDDFDSVVLAQISGISLPQNYQGEDILDYQTSLVFDQNFEFKHQNFWFGFSLSDSGKIFLIDNLFVGSQLNEFADFNYYVDDLNYDGYMDFYYPLSNARKFDDILSDQNYNIYGFQNKTDSRIEPVDRMAVFLNNQQGALVRAYDYPFPFITENSKDYLNFSNSLYDDFNNDGIRDFLIYSRNPLLDSDINAKSLGDIYFGVKNPFVVGIFSDLYIGSSELDYIFIDDSSENYIFSNHHKILVMINTLLNFNVGLDSIERIKFLDKNIAFDLNSNAGIVAKVLGSVFGPGSVSNKDYVGIGLSIIDSGITHEVLMQIALEAKLGVDASNAEVVDLLYTNIVGQEPSTENRDYFISLLEDGIYTQASIGIMAADTTLNSVNIDLVGLAETGLEYAIA